MSTQGRRGGTRRKRSQDTAAAPAESMIPPVVAATASEPDAEVLDERSVPIAAGGGVARIGRPLAGAILGTLLVAGLALGSALGPGGALGPKDDSQREPAEAAGLADIDGSGAGEGVGHHDSDRSGDEYLGDEPKASTEPDEAGGEEPVDTDKPAAEPTDKPEPDATRKPEPKPDPTKPPSETISLTVWIKEYHPVMEWGSCAGLDFDYYKVVRSTDSTVTWPAGENDELIAVVEPGGNRKAWDGAAPHGKKAWYRVFCVRHTDAGYKVLASSNAKGIEVPEEPAPPDPISLGFEASINDEGAVVLDWTACEVDGFGFYKVLRSTWNEHPSYLPWNDGTEVIGVVEDMHTTTWLDAGGDSGQTVYYRVQCLGWVGGQKVLLGQTAVVAVTMP